MGMKRLKNLIATNYSNPATDCLCVIIAFFIRHGFA